MQYKVNPSTIVSVESGSIASEKGDHLFVETEPISQMDLESKSAAEVADNREVFVLCVEDRATGEQQNLALNLEDMIKLTKENLMHLSVAGDTISQQLCRMLHTFEDGDDNDDYGESDEFDTSG